MTSNYFNWKDTLLPPSSTLSDAIASLNNSSAQIVLVASETYQLLGTVTDGDIRRALLRGASFSSCITEVLVQDPLVSPPQMSREDAIRLMRINKIQHLPIVDAKRVILGIHLISAPDPPHKANTMIIMAGGVGKRLMPLTHNCPKPLLPVAGKPILQHIVERASTQGFTNFIISIRHLGHMIEDFFGDGSTFAVNIQYLREKEPLGTAGALTLLEETPESSIVVTNGDILSDVNYGDMLEFHNRYAAAATMAIRSYEWQHPYGVVNIDGIEIVGIEEKPTYQSHVNTGIYVLHPATINQLSKNKPMDMPSLFLSLQSNGHRIIAYPMHEPWLDIGRLSDYNEANQRSKVE